VLNGDNNMDLSLLSVGAMTLGIKELAEIILGYCDVTTSIALLQCTKGLYGHKNNEHLWRNKINKELGVARFKLVRLTFYQQYISLRSQFTVDSATKLGRCDQLRILRRKAGLSYPNIINMAAEYDQDEIIRYIEEYERYIMPSERFSTAVKIGPKVAVYYAAKAFLDPKNKYAVEHLDILKILFLNESLPEDFGQLMMDANNAAAALWYEREVYFRQLILSRSTALHEK
jgi:hypothetical protein